MSFPWGYNSTGEIQLSFPGGYNSTGWIQLSFLGVYNSTGGIQLSFQGVYNSTGGIQISFPGGLLFLNPDLKCVPNLERILENKKALTILTVLFKHFPFPFRSVLLLIDPKFFFFRTMGLFLTVPFVLGKERSFHQERAQPYLFPTGNRNKGKGNGRISESLQ